MVRRFRGNPPSAADGWIRIGQIKGSDGMAWDVWARANGEKEWATGKICACGFAENKANYWIGWNVKRMRHNRRRDSGILANNHPELAAQFDALMRKNNSMLADIASGK